MQIKCTYCGQFISDTDPVCPYCAAPNELLKRASDGIPRTMVELKAWALEKKYPIGAMRVFIGVDYREPRAYGIYQDEATGNFSVYKNKADGSRAIRYEGKDEAYAVNELYMKIKEEGLKQQEFQKQKAAGQQPVQRTQQNSSKRRKTSTTGKALHRL